MDFWESGVAVWRRRQNHLSPEVRRRGGLPMQLFPLWTRGLARRPRKGSVRGGLQSGGRGEALGSSLSGTQHLVLSLHPGSGSEVAGTTSDQEMWTNMTVPGPRWANYYFSFLLLLWRFRDKEIEILCEQRLS